MPMKLDTARTLVLALAILLSISVCHRPPPRGLESTLIAKGRLAAPIRVVLFDPLAGAHPEVTVERIAVMRVVLEPGGAIEWHEHGGPVWAIITAGRVAFYEDAPSCEPRYFAAGDAWLEPGRRIHAARNEGEEPAEVFATFMLPRRMEPRMTAPRPSLCPL